MLHLGYIKNINFKKVIHQQAWTLTANYLPMFKVTSTTIYKYIYIKPKLCRIRFHSQGMILYIFFKKKIQNRYMEPETPPLRHRKKPS